MLTIELQPPVRSEPCSCCGGGTTSLTRFVHRNGDAHAIYYARYSDNHTDRVVSATVSIGEWGDGSTPQQRVAFAVRLHADDDNFKVSVIDAAESPWHDAALIGRTLNRGEALAHPLIAEVFHITDHMFREDKPLIGYLNGGRT